MRIVHVAPVWLPVSAASHGGIETLLAQLVAAQHKLGHDVVLVAAGGSEVSGTLVEAVPEALVPLMERGEADDYAYYEQALVGAAARTSHAADVVHNHVIPGGLVLDDVLTAGPPILHTLHVQVTKDLVWALRSRPRAVVAVSAAQAAVAGASGATLFGVTHNGLDMDDVPYTSAKGEDLLFLGRVEPQKGPDTAIATARALGRRLVLAGPVTDRAYFDEVITPLLADDVRYAGVLGPAAKFAALASSACLLVPSRWAEPFGMVSIEAMAAGTPVAALARGALPEIIEQGVTGYAVAEESQLPQAVLAAVQLDRELVRKAARERFHITAVAARYTAQYERLVAGDQACGS